MPSLSFESDYGKWKNFEISDGGKIKTEFRWDDPDGLPKPVLQTFTKKLTETINNFMKDDEKRAEAIRKRIADWEKKIGAGEIKSGKELIGFVETVNSSLAERFPGISGGVKGVSDILTAQTMKALPKDVANQLEKAKFVLKCTIVGKAVLAISVVGLSIAATVLTGGLALPIAAAAVTGAVQLGKSGVAAYKSLQAAQDCSTALTQILETQRSAAKAAQGTIDRAESELFILQGQAKTAEAQVAALKTKIDEIKAIYGRKEVDGIEILSNISVKTLAEINALWGKLDAWKKKSSDAQSAVDKFSATLSTVKRAFDPSLFDKLAKEDWKAKLGDFATTYGSDIQNLVSGAQSLTKLVTST
jgi:hypothetical protein